MSMQSIQWKPIAAVLAAVVLFGVAIRVGVAIYNRTQPDPTTESLNDAADSVNRSVEELQKLNSPSP